MVHLLAILKYRAAPDGEKGEMLNPETLVALVEDDGLEDLRIHDNLDAFEVFVRYVIPPVVRKMLFRTKRIKEKVSTFVTVFDEAFAMLVLENNAEKWKIFYDNENQHGLTSKKGKSAKPRYCPTSGVDAKQSTYTGNWTEEGIDRYNELCDLVHQKRGESHIDEDENDIRDRLYGTFGKKGGYYRRDVDETAQTPVKRVRRAYNGLNWNGTRVAEV